MKTRAFLAVFLLCAFAPIATPDDSVSKRTITVVIDSRPEHAEIRLNGKFIGTTPLSYRLPAGEHAIELKHPQFSSWTRELTVTDTPTRVVALLEPAAKAAAKCVGQTSELR